MAGRKEPMPPLLNKEVSSQMRGTIQDLSSHFSHRLSPLSTTNMEIHNVFHASLLLTYRETAEHRPNFTNPPPEEIESEEEYEIAEILSHWGSPCRHSYLVSWKGYSLAENTWEPKGNLQHTQTILAWYKQQNGL